MEKRGSLKHVRYRALLDTLVGRIAAEMCLYDPNAQKLLLPMMVNTFLSLGRTVNHKWDKNTLCIAREKRPE